MRPRASSIRWWLWGLVAAAALPLLALLAWLFLTQVQRERMEAQTSAQRVAEALAQQLSALHSDGAALLERMAARPQVVQAVAQCDSLFAVVDFFPQYISLFETGAGGEVRCSSQPQPADVALADRARETVLSGIRDGSYEIGRSILQPYGDVWLLIQSLPLVTGEEKPRALVLVQAAEIVGDEALSPESVVTLLDSEGTVLARTGDEEAWRGKEVRRADVTQVVLSSKRGRAEAAGVDGVVRQYGFTDLPELGWHVVVGVPSEVVMAPVRDLWLRGLIGGALVILIVALFAMRLGRVVERPIGELEKAAGSVARMGYTTTVPVGGPREIAALGEAFNAMLQSRARAEEEVAESERRLRALSDRLMFVQEEERSRIAREIHDELGQALTALKMDIGGLISRTESSALRDRVLRTLDTTVSAVQRISSELRPSVLDDLGLIAAMETEAAHFEERTGIECDLSLDSAGLDLSPEAESTVYRIVQEALTNVARHSDATRVEIRLRLRENEVLVEVRDDGRGITPEQLSDRRSLGLIGMRERAAILGGAVTVEGFRNRGTIVSLRIPRAPAEEG